MSYVRCSIIGTIVGGEVWSVNPVFDPSGELETPVNQTNLDAAALAIVNLTPGANMRVLMSTALQITQCRLEVRADADDHLLAISIAGRSTALGGTGTARQSAQAATVVSLRTDTPGGSGRGRMYWPAIGASVSDTLRLNETQLATLPAEFKTYLTAIRSALATNFPLIGFDLAVRSKTTHTTPHVVRLQVGDIIDTQRRRRDALPETYLSVAFP